MELMEIFFGAGIFLLLAVLIGAIMYLKMGNFQRISSAARWKNLVWRHPYSPNHGAVLDEQVVSVKFSSFRARPILFFGTLLRVVSFLSYFSCKIKICEKGIVLEREGCAPIFAPWGTFLYEGWSLIFSDDELVGFKSDWLRGYMEKFGAVKQEKHEEVYKQNNQLAPLVFVIALMVSVLYAIWGATWRYETLKNGVDATAYFKEDYSGKWATYVFYAPQKKQNVEIKERSRFGMVDGEAAYKKSFPVRYNQENPKKYLRSDDLLKNEWVDFYVGLQFVGLIMVGFIVLIFYAITSRKSAIEIASK